MNECVCTKYFFTPSTMNGITIAIDVKSPPDDKSTPT